MSNKTFRATITSERPALQRINVNGQEIACYEILSHDPACIDLSRFTDGTALLVDHDKTKLAGSISDITLDEDGCLRADLRFSRSQLGQDTQADIEDGHRTGISVGYTVSKYEQTNDQIDGLPVYKAVRWQPFEATSLPYGVQADMSATVNRASGDNALFRSFVSSDIKFTPGTSSYRAQGKTKHVADEDLSASDFIIVGDKDDTSTWHLPWHFSTEEKTKSHLRNALARFDQLKVPSDVKVKAKAKLLRLCKEHGITTSERAMTRDLAAGSASTPTASGNGGGSAVFTQKPRKPKMAKSKSFNEESDQPFEEPSPEVKPRSRKIKASYGDTVEGGDEGGSHLNPDKDSIDDAYAYGAQGRDQHDDDDSSDECEDGDGQEDGRCMDGEERASATDEGEYSAMPKPAKGLPSVGAHKSGRAMVKSRNGEAAEIVRLGQQHNIPQETTADWLANGLSVGQVSHRILNMSNERNGTPAGRGYNNAMDAVKANENRPFSHRDSATGQYVSDMSDKERRQYSIKEMVRQISAGEKPNCMAWDVSEQFRKSTGKEYTAQSAFYVPLDLPMTREMQKQLQRDLAAGAASTPTAGTGGGGGTAVFTQMGSTQIIEYLYNRTKCISLGAQTFTGLTAPIRFVRQSGSGQAQWRSELGTGNNNNLGLDYFQLQQNGLYCQQQYSREFFHASSYSPDQMIINDMVRGTAVAVDAAILNPSGTNASGQPASLFQMSNGGVQTTIYTGSLGTSGSNLTYAALVALETQIAKSNADTRDMAFLTRPGVRGQLVSVVLENPGATNSSFCWRENNTIRGYRAEVSQNVWGTGIKGTVTGQSTIILGDWTQLLVANFGGAEMIVDPYSLSTQGEIRLTYNTWWDANVRHPLSFAAYVDITGSL